MVQGLQAALRVQQGRSSKHQALANLDVVWLGGHPVHRGILKWQCHRDRAVCWKTCRRRDSGVFFFSFWMIWAWV